MSTRTAIFKELEDGTYQGIYVHNDGYIDYTGKLLHRYYAGNNKIDYIMKQKHPIKSLGESEEMININTEKKLSMERNADGFMKYTATASDNITASQMYFKADTIQDIINFQYLTYDERDTVQGFFVEDEFIPYKGSDNNGYLYLQDQDGNWYVSYMRNNNGDMSDFTLLSNVLSK